MNLLDLFVKIGVQDEASSSIDAISATMIAKAELMAAGVKAALSKIWEVGSGVIGGAVDAMATYEQQIGGMETFFGNASQTVIENAKKAYDTAGMSANEYMSTVSTFAMSLIESVKERRVGAIEEATEEETAIQSAALDQQVADMQTAISDQTTAMSREHQKQRTSYSDMLTDQLSEYTKQLSSEVDKRRTALAEELDALRDELSDEVEERRKAQQTHIAEIQKQNAREISERQKANAAILSDLQKANSQELSNRTKALSKELQEYQKSLQREVEAFRSATDAKIKEIDREYTERLKLTDEEEYNRLKAIDEQIEALDAQTEAERKAEKERDRQRRIASLKDEINTALYVEDREKAQQELSDYLAGIEQEDRETSREEQKKALREESQRVKDEYAARRQKIKDEESKVVEDYREARGKELEALQESNTEKLEERREANSSAIEALREEQQARVDAISDEQAAEIEALRESQSEQLEIVRDTYSQELTELQNTNAEIIKERQTKNSEELSELQEHVSKLTTERQRANRDALTDFDQNQQDQQEVMRRTLNAQLDDLRKYVEQQKAILNGEDTGEYIETLAEDQAEAARLADMAIIDMADNANKMGTPIEMIQSAYAGFAKQNFTMLDNLRLGFGGTKEEMERLLETAEGIQQKNGNMVDYSIESFADIVEAIHTVQEAYSVAGTTAAEGADTVEGTTNRMKAAWDNFLISLGDPDGDVDAALENLLGSVELWLDKIVPLVSTILDKLIPIVTEKGAVIAQQLWDAIYNAIPEDKKEEFAGVVDSIKAIGDAVIGLSEHLPLISTIVGGLLAFNGVASAVDSVNKVLGVLNGASALGGVAGAAGGAAGGLATVEGAAATAAGAGGLGALATAMAPFVAGGALIVGVGGGLLYLVGTNEELMKSIEGVVTKTDDLKTDTEIQTAAIGSDWEKMTKAAETSVEETSKNIEVTTAGMYTDIYSKMRDTRETVETESDGASTSATSSFDKMRDGIGTSFDGAKGAMDNLVATWKGDTSEIESDTDTKTSSIKTKFDNNVNKVKDSAQDAIKTASDKWKSGLSNMETETNTKSQKIETTADKCATSVEKSFTGVKLDVAGNNIMVGLYNGLLSAWNDKVVPFISGLGQWIQDNKGPESYDRKLLIKNGQWIMQSLSDGLEDGFAGDVRPEVENMANRLEDAMGTTQMQVDFDEMETAFKRATENIMDTWHTGLDRMADDVRYLAAKTQEALAESFSPFAQSVQSSMGLATSSQGQGMPTVVNAVLELDHVQFGRLVYNLNREQEQRVGIRLAGGFV